MGRWRSVSHDQYIPGLAHFNGGMNHQVVTRMTRHGDRRPGQPTVLLDGPDADIDKPASALRLMHRCRAAITEAGDDDGIGTADRTNNLVLSHGVLHSVHDRAPHHGLSTGLSTTSILVTMRTQVAIVGAGPAGTLLALLLHGAGIDSVVVERQSRQHVLDRVRAGVLEWGTVGVLRDAGLAVNMDRNGVVHNGARMAWGGRSLFFDIAARTHRHFMAYGQAPLQRDLYDAADASGLTIIDRTTEVVPHDVTTASPYLTYRKEGREDRIDADYIVGSDGYHGVCRSIIPTHAVRTYEKEYPFGWLGVLSETPPLHDLVYCNHARGFALASQRNSMLSRYYVQCPLEDRVEDWPDDRFWNELLTRFPEDLQHQIVTGPTIEKSIAPLRSFVAEPLRYGNMFLAGDAAHIVPPTGAKGLNLAVSDVYYLSRGFADHYLHHDDRELDRYSEVALKRIWGAVRFSWWMTTLLHRFPHQTEFDQRMQEAELDYIAESEHAQSALSEQYAGLPFERSLRDA